MQPLKHLPEEEREKAGLQRRKGLELLYEKIRNLWSRLERKEEMLKDYEANMEQLRYRTTRWPGRYWSQGERVRGCETRRNAGQGAVRPLGRDRSCGAHSTQRKR